MRAARTAGTNVAATATPDAFAATRPMAEAPRAGVPGAPTRPAPGPVSSGAVSQPASSPTPAAHHATTTFSNSITVATSAGVPPTAFTRPTRRVCPAIRPPTSTVTLASASRASSQLPVSRTSCSLLIVVASWSRMVCHDARNGAVGEVSAS
jgi:hypothetical protein